MTERWTVAGEVYEVEVGQLLGEGATGRVHRATDSRGSALAIKRIPHVGAGHSARELDLSTSLAGHSLPNVIGVRVADRMGNGDVAIVMELADTTLREEMNAGAPLAEGEVVPRLMDIASGLEQLGRHGIIHRDLKPENVLRVGEQLKISDFGIGRLVGLENTRTFRDRGTSPYMAPEQWTGSMSTTQTDLYALGCIAFELLNGAPPFQSELGGEIGDQHLREQPPALPEAVTPKLEFLVRKLLNKDPVDRPPDARSVLEALRRVGAPVGRVGAALEAVSRRLQARTELDQAAEARMQQAADVSAQRLRSAFAAIELVRDELILEHGLERASSSRAIDLENFAYSESLEREGLRLTTSIRRPLAAPKTPDSEGHVLLIGAIDVQVDRWTSRHVVNLACVFEAGSYVWHTYQLRHHAGPIPEAPHQLRLVHDQPAWGVPLEDWEREVGYGRGPGSHPLEVGYQTRVRPFGIDTFADCIESALHQDPDGLGLRTEVAGAMASRADRGWYREDDLWCFGLGGTAMLVLSVRPTEPRPLLLYEHAKDVEHRFGNVEELISVLDPLERQYRGPTDLQLEIAHGTDVVNDVMRSELLRELDAQDNALGEAEP